MLTARQFRRLGPMSSLTIQGGHQFIQKLRYCQVLSFLYRISVEHDEARRKWMLHIAKVGFYEDFCFDLLSIVSISGPVRGQWALHVSAQH